MLTNGMRPMRLHERALLALKARVGEKLVLRSSLDHHHAELHDRERGAGSFDITLAGLRWLAQNGLHIAVAGRHFSGEGDLDLRAGYQALFDANSLRLDAADPTSLVLFPELDARVDVPEITTACWGILHKSPDDVMCASSRMVVKRKGANKPVVLACTLLAYDERFELGATLADAAMPVSLNHPHCAKFCVLGGAACSR